MNILWIYTLIFFCFPWQKASSDIGSLEIQVTGIKSEHGKIILDVFSSKEGFPIQTDNALRRLKASILNGRAAFKVPDLKSGEYAFALIHDENGNNKLDLNFIGIPKEGAAASRNAKGFISPPSFEQAKFRIDSSEVKMTIMMLYF